jgi:tRNA(Ile)-lysidine synthase
MLASNEWPRATNGENIWVVETGAFNCSCRDGRARLAFLSNLHVRLGLTLLADRSVRSTISSVYHVSVAELAQTVLAYIRKHDLLKPGDRVAVAVSGGADSVALLCLLAELRGELGIVLAAIHFNHKLRATDSDQDEQFVAGLAHRLRLESQSETGDVTAHAKEKHLSVETAARKLRYEYFQRLLRENQFNRIATAHTLDDQAETVLLKLIRGAGTRGMAGIYPKLVADFEGAAIIRPLLDIRRKDIEAYLADIQQAWREDKSNRDLRHSRNRVRHGILPRLERNLNPAVYETLAETAEVARAEEDYWSGKVAQLLSTVWENSLTPKTLGGALNLKTLTDLPLALQRRVIRGAAESLGLKLEFRQVEEILETAFPSQQSADSPTHKSMLLPNQWKVSRQKSELHFECQTRTGGPSDYEYSLPIPGSIDVPELGSRFESKFVGRNAVQGYNPEHLFDPGLLAKELTVRNWRPGDRFWPAHSKAPRKIKELLQDRQVTGTERKLWPIVLSGDEIIWLRGFPAPAKLQPQENSSQTLLLQELPLL